MTDKLSDLVQAIQAFSKARDWEQFHDPKNMAISLNLEATEVLELFQWTKDNNIRPEKLGELPDELADVFYWLILLANHYEVDLVSALESKMKKNAEKYPVSKAKGVSKKYTEL